MPSAVECGPCGRPLILTGLPSSWRLDPADPESARVVDTAACPETSTGHHPVIPGIPPGTPICEAADLGYPLCPRPVKYVARHRRAEPGQQGVFELCGRHAMYPRRQPGWQVRALHDTGTGTDAETPAGDDDGEVAISFTRAEIEAWAGRPLTDQELDQLAEQLPASRLPWTVRVLVEAMTTDTPKD